MSFKKAAAKEKGGLSNLFSGIKNLGSVFSKGSSNGTPKETAKQTLKVKEAAPPAIEKSKNNL